MRFGINNPVFLQAAGNAPAKEYLSFVDTKGNPKIRLSCDGGLRIVSTYNGDEMIQTLSNISQQTVSIQSDPNTEIFIYGKVTLFSAASPNPSERTYISELNTLYAKSLTDLNCSNNSLTSLDVSANTALTYLNCSSNQLTSLDVSANTALTYLGCDATMLTSLDVSANTALTDLSCYNNSLTSLDVSANTALTTLRCSNNRDITAIQSVAVNSDVASAIAGLINNANSTTGIVTLRNGDEFNSAISDAATTKGWTVDWAVERVDA